MITYLHTSGENHPRTNRSEYSVTKYLAGALHSPHLKQNTTILERGLCSVLLTKYLLAL